MFFTIKDILTEKEYDVNVTWITSLRNGDDEKSAPNFDLLIFEGDGGRPLVESYSSESERNERKEAIKSCGSFFTVEDIAYNIMWVQSTGKINAGEVLVDGNVAQKDLCKIKFVNGTIIYGAFDTEAERDEFYENVSTMSGGGGLLG